jgi:hypothetical protein
MQKLQINSRNGDRAYTYRAELLNKANEQSAPAKRNENITANITIFSVEKACSYIAEEIYVIEKTDEAENLKIMVA